MTKDIQHTDYSAIDVAAMSPEDLLALADDVGFISIPGFTNVAAADLLGLPFIVTGVRYQAPTPDKGREGCFRDYVTLECTAHNEQTIRTELDKGRIVRGMNAGMQVLTEMNQLPVSPGERFVVNDGSTGIRRTLTEIFHRLGLVTVREGEWNKEDKTPFDLASNLWVKWDAEQSWKTAGGEFLPYFTHRPDGRPFLMKATRGLHASWFVNEYTGPDGAITYYL